VKSLLRKIMFSTPLKQLVAVFSEEDRESDCFLLMICFTELCFFSLELDTEYTYEAL
jgi:hypothetical protein